MTDAGHMAIIAGAMQYFLLDCHVSTGEGGGRMDNGVVVYVRFSSRRGRTMFAGSS